MYRIIFLFSATIIAYFNGKKLFLWQEKILKVKSVKLSDD